MLQCALSRVLASLDISDSGGPYSQYTPCKEVLINTCRDSYLIPVTLTLPVQGCPMVALEQISRSAEFRICSEALAPKMGLEQIRANICSSRANF